MLRLCCGLLACCWLGLAVAEEPSFELGVLPNMETVELIRQYQPLASYLREQLGMPVLVRTRATYDRFARAAQAGEFDLIVTAPHLARLAEQEGGLRPLVSFAGELRLVAVLPAGSSLEELRARPVLTMAVPDRIAWVALMGEAWLAQQMPQAEIRLRAYRSHRNAVRAVQQGESDITFWAVMLSRLDEEQLDDMELMGTGVVGPNLIVLCREKAEGSCDELAVLLERFPESSHGRRFFADLQAEGWTAAPELSYYDSLLPRLRARMPEL